MPLAEKKSVKIEQKHSTSLTRHPIQAAKLLYSAPNFILRGPIYLIFIIVITAVFYSFWAKKDILVVAPLTLEKESVTIEAIGGGQIIDVGITQNQEVSVHDLFFKVQEQIRSGVTTEQQSFGTQIDQLYDERAKIKDEAAHKLAQFDLDLKDLTVNRKKLVKDIKVEIVNIERQIKSSVREVDLRKKEYNLAKKEYKKIIKRYNERKATNSQKNNAEQLKDRRYDSMKDAQASLDHLKDSLVVAKRKLETYQDAHGLEKLKSEIAQTKIRRDRDIKRINDKIQRLNERIQQSQTLVPGVYYKENVAVYTSIADALVTDIHVKKGEIISPGQALVTYIRDSTALEARLLIHNKDIGKIKRGQRVKIKYFAFPYQEFGIPEGTIYYVAKRPGGIKGFETMYVVKATLDKETITDGSREHTLDIGLEGMAEIKTGDKRLIELVFRPISRFFKKDEDEE